MPEFTVTIKIKSGKRTPMEVYNTYWHNKEVFVKGIEKPLTIKNIGKFMSNALIEKVEELGGETKNQI